MFYYVLTDAYNVSVNDSVSIIINSNQPLVTINLTDDYITGTQDVFVKSYFFNNLSYELSNDSGVQSTYTDTNVLLQNKSEYNITIDTSGLDEGSYTLSIAVNDDSQTTTFHSVRRVESQSGNV